MPVLDRIIVKRQADYHERVGSYFTYRTDVRIDAKMADMLREFIQDRKYSDMFILVDERGNEVKQ